MNALTSAQRSLAARYSPAQPDLRDLQRLSFAEMADAALEQRAHRGQTADILAATAALAGSGHAYLRTHTVPWAELRDLTAGAPAAGGNLVPTTTAGAQLALADWSVVAAAGTPLVNLAGNITIPRTVTDLAVQWLTTEAATINPATPTTGQVALSPKTAGSMFTFSRQLALTGGAVFEGFMRGHLRRAAARAVDTGTLAGTGTAGQPLGFVNDPNITALSGLTWANLLAAQQAAEQGGAGPGAVWIMSAATKQTLRGLAAGSSGGPAIPPEQDVLLARRVLTSEAMPAGTVLYGDFTRGALVTLFGAGPELALDPYGPNGANFRGLKVDARVLVSMDCALVQPAAFAKVVA
jgi:HK97 family phage major capsid protein